MILADKIIENRKKNGWSQEELAEKLGVSRQSVSKWESAQSIPDMKKILLLSETFGVSTDYLLRDEIEERQEMETVQVDLGTEDEVRSVSMEEANAFLLHNEKAARSISTGVMLCILSPIILILLAGMSEMGMISIAEEVAEIGGTVILLIMVSIAVALFLMAALKGKEYEYLENSFIDTEYGVSGMVKDRSGNYAEIHSRLLIVGIMLCVIAVIPLLGLEAMRYSNNTDFLPLIGVAVLLAMVAAGVKLIVLTCIRQGGYQKLLETGDYSRINKRVGRFDGIYWAIALAIYLCWSFITSRWDITWIVWPIGGVLFAAYREIIKLIVQSRSGNR